MLVKKRVEIFFKRVTQIARQGLTGEKKKTVRGLCQTHAPSGVMGLESFLGCGVFGFGRHAGLLAGLGSFRTTTATPPLCGGSRNAFVGRQLKRRSLNDHSRKHSLDIRAFRRKRRRRLPVGVLFGSSGFRLRFGLLSL